MKLTSGQLRVLIEGEVVDFTNRLAKKRSHESVDASMSKIHSELDEALLSAIDEEFVPRAVRLIRDAMPDKVDNQASQRLRQNLREAMLDSLTLFLEDVVSGDAYEDEF